MKKQNRKEKKKRRKKRKKKGKENILSPVGIGTGMLDNVWEDRDH